MTKRQVTLRIKAILLVIGEILWRSFGLSLRYLPVGLAAGATITLTTGDTSALVIGALGGWLGALFKAYGEIGEEIARTARVTKAGINRGFRMAVEIIEQQEKEIDNKGK